MDDLTFDYRGEIRGVNTAALEGVPTMASDGTFCFVSTRAYEQTLSTLYCGQFSAGIVPGVALLQNLSRRQAGLVNFDIEISPDGRTLYFVDGKFSGGPVPQSADLAIALRGDTGFTRDAQSNAILRAINTPALEYAAAISSDDLELFFTRLDTVPTIYRAARAQPDQPFDRPARVRAIEGFAGAPTLSPDARSLYYHHKDAGTFALYRVERPVPRGR